MVTAESTRSKPRISTDSVTQLYDIRAQEAEGRERYVPTYRKIAKYFNPSMADWDYDSPDGDQPEDQSEVFENAGMKASSRLTDGIQAYAFSRSNPWARIATEDEALMERGDVAEWLQRVELHLYSQFAKSSFYDDGRSFVRNGSDFGTSVMFRSNNVRRAIPQYQTLHLKRTLMMENESGEVDTLFRDFWMSPMDAVATFGRDTLPQTIKDSFIRGDTKKFMFTQFIFPRDKFDLDIDLLATRGMPFYSLYVADCDQSNPIREGGYEVKPFFVWRWSRNPDGDVWGVDSPGMMEISNVKQANGLRKDYHRMVQQLGRPMIKATEQLRGRINFIPNGVTYLKPGEDFTAAQTIGQLAPLIEDLKWFQSGINESYHTDLFLVLTENIQRTKTATEVEGIRGEQSAMLTAFFGRLSSEFLEPSVEDLFQIELDSGRLPPPPQSLQGKKIKIDMVSPLAQLQKRYLRLDNTRQAILEIAQLAQLDPTVLDKLNLDEQVNNIAKMYNMDRKVIRDLFDVSKIRQSRAQQQAAMVQMQMQMAAAKQKTESYTAATKAPEEGSPAEALVGKKSA